MAQPRCYVYFHNTTNLDERGAAEKEAKHVSHDVITDNTGDGHNKPAHTTNCVIQKLNA